VGATGATGTAFTVPQNVHLHGLCLPLSTNQTIAQSPQVKKVIRKWRIWFGVSWRWSVCFPHAAQWSPVSFILANAPRSLSRQSA